jgi:hypothetical protein
VSPFRALLSQQPDLFSLTARTLNPLSAYSCKLFGAVEKPNSFAIKQIQTLCAKCRGMASAGLPGGHPGWGIPATAPGLKSATYKLFPPRPVCKQVTPPPALSQARFSRVTDHKSLPGGVRFLTDSVGSVPPRQIHPLSPLEYGFTPSHPITPSCPDGRRRVSTAHFLGPDVSVQSIFKPFIFTVLQIPFPVTPFIAHRYKTLGVCGPSELCALCVSAFKRGFQMPLALVNNRPPRGVLRIGAE